SDGGRAVISAVRANRLAPTMIGQAIENGRCAHEAGLAGQFGGWDESAPLPPFAFVPLRQGGRQERVACADPSEASGLSPRLLSQPRTARSDERCRGQSDWRRRHYRSTLPRGCLGGQR